MRAMTGIPRMGRILSQTTWDDKKGSVGKGGGAWIGGMAAVLGVASLTGGVTVLGFAALTPTYGVWGRHDALVQRDGACP